MTIFRRLAVDGRAVNAYFPTTSYNDGDTQWNTGNWAARAFIFRP
jgi:hypothetical protein